MNRLHGGDVVRLWSIVGLYIGGIIGAGFASGQELVVFFTNYGVAGMVGIVVAILLLSLGTMLVLDFCARHSVSSYATLLGKLDPKRTHILDVLYSVFLLIGNSVMFAGIGAIGDTPWSSFHLRVITGLLVLLVLRRGVEGVARASAWLAPVLVFILCALSIDRLRNLGIRIPTHGSWQAMEAATLYSSYNLGFSMTVLASIQTSLKSQRKRLAFVIIANIILGISMVLLFFALGTLTPEELSSPFPLGHLFNSRGVLAIGFYRLMLWGAMYSTAMAHSLALVSRTTEMQRFSWTKSSVLVVLLSLALSYAGFATLIRVAYPILGLAGLWILANLVRERMA